MSGHGGKREGAGRPAGSANKRSEEIQDLLDRLNCNPIEGMALIANGNIPCKACNETGQVTVLQFYKIIGKDIPNWAIDSESREEMENKSSEVTVCPSCAGEKIDPVGLGIRANMYKELAQYVAAKRKAIEVSGDPESPIQHDHVVEFIGVAD